MKVNKNTVRHNHPTYDIKSEGECPGCDYIHAKIKRSCGDCGELLDYCGCENESL